MDECFDIVGIATWGWIWLAAATGLGGYMVGMLRNMRIEDARWLKREQIVEEPWPLYTKETLADQTERRAAMDGG